MIYVSPLIRNLQVISDRLESGAASDEIEPDEIELYLYFVASLIFYVIQTALLSFGATHPKTPMIAQASRKPGIGTT